jgi:TrmH family RNA methyltransferase
VYAKLAFGERVEGIVAVAHMPTRTLDTIKLPAAPLVAVIEAIEKPGNLGAILRTADAAGASAVLVADAGTDLFNPNAIRASQGVIFHLPLAAATTGEILAWLRAHQLHIFAARVDGAIDYRAADYGPPSAIVLGSEDRGLSDAWRAADITAIRLPMLGAGDSLNVSVTAGVLLYEALRQRESR